MNSLRRILLVATMLASLTAFALASNPVGTWKGHIVVDDSKMTIKDPAQIKTAKQQFAAARKIAVTLTLKADKTFTGGPPASTGTWSQKGNAVTLTAKGPNGKPGSQVFTLSKDGKSMTLNLPTTQGIKMKVVLTR